MASAFDAIIRDFNRRAALDPHLVVVCYGASIHSPLPACLRLMLRFFPRFDFVF